MSGVCKELQSRNISVNNLAPGPMDTRKLLFSDPEIPQSVKSNKTSFGIQLSSIPRNLPRPWNFINPMVWVVVLPKSRILPPLFASFARMVLGLLAKLFSPMVDIPPANPRAAHRYLERVVSDFIG